MKFTKTMIPIISIIGRPNVGKSTLFNRLISSNRSVITDIPGTTRDRIYDEISINDKKFIIVDTGGIMKIDKNFSSIDKEVQEQANLSINESDLLLFMIDGKIGLTLEDRNILKTVQKSKVKYLVIVNKIDNKKEEQDLFDNVKIGENYIKMSTYHKTGIYELKDRIFEEIGNYKESTESESSRTLIPVSIVGKPNVGKSTLFNMISENRKSIVSDIAGTTRDPIDSIIQYNDYDIKIIDTAGIKRKSKISSQIDFYSYLRSIRAIADSKISLLVIDGETVITHYEKSIIEEIVSKSVSCMIVINKWDIIKEAGGDKDDYAKYLSGMFNFCKWIPFFFVSAKYDNGKNKLLDRIIELYKSRNIKIPTSKLNKYFEELKTTNPPKALNSTVKTPKIYYMTQISSEPPTFKVFTNDKDSIHSSYTKFLENKLRAEFELYGSPIKIEYTNRR